MEIHAYTNKKTKTKNKQKTNKQKNRSGRDDNLKQRTIKSFSVN